MMPKGEPTRTVTIRIPEEMAVQLEKQAAAEGKSPGLLLQEIVMGQVRKPSRLYTWAESKERAKYERSLLIWQERTLTLRRERDAPCRLLGQIREWLAGRAADDTAAIMARIAEVTSV